MTAKERLHQLIDEMHDDQAAVLLMDLEERHALSDEDRASIERGFADSKAGRTTPHAEIAAKYGLNA